MEKDFTAIKIGIGIILNFLCLCNKPTIIYGLTSSNSYDPVPLTPFNGLKLGRERATLFENPNSRNNIYSTQDNGIGADDSKSIFWPFQQTSLHNQQVASDSALFRSTLPENQKVRPATTYQSAGFPLLNSPNGVVRGDGRSYGVDALPPNYYFISPKDSNQPPAQFQLPPEPLNGTPQRSSSLYGIRRIPEGLRRKQYYPSADQVGQTQTFQPSPIVIPYSATPTPLLRSSGTKIGHADTTFHTFYAPKYNNYIPITRYHHDAHPTNGEYNVEFETGNGIYQKESGFIKKINVYNPRTRTYETKDITVKTGTVAWTSPEGIPFTMSYIADENGFRPTGSHIPKIGGSLNDVTGRSNNNYDTPVIPPNPLYHHVHKQKR